ncbi:cation efflux family-domain-containing protein [Phakopsora pachyrhizi]|uniref:Cation efflux family-domain-containing protein n=1 Tax=Phakopsora pachyrhizi TaxID=170000 RepID=A0AAV0BRJ4_PHAPC|nr:cation efflux family-domain-containing protein [Phakopsora pachyrhizi]CAH7688991.1 cation efflux family-domain-containing protein [Phakopsora pachyrhizi]
MEKGTNTSLSSGDQGEESTLSPNQQQLPSPPPSPLDHPDKELDLEANSLSRSSSISNQPISFDIITHRKPKNYVEGFSWAEILAPGGNEDDPLLLKDRLQDETALSKLRKRGRKAKPVGNFYQVQNEHINNLLKSLEEDAKEAQIKTEASAKRGRIAIRASFIVNCLLAVIQIYSAISSMSLSFFASALDAIFDPCANFALNYSHKYADRVDLRNYPSGGSRFETIGNIIYSAVMACASVVLVVESIEVLVKAEATEPKLHIPAIAGVCVSFLAKLALFLYCWGIRNEDSQVKVLWEDHRNDLFINGFGIFTNAAGAKIKWWIDPLGGMMISLALIFLWMQSITREFRLLAGESAPVDFMQKVVYKAMTFSSYIEKIDSCKCYHVGPNYFVEIDIVMDGNTPLWLAHDLGQELQDKLEALPNVDRAFVHLDHEVEHKPEHSRHK